MEADGGTHDSAEKPRFPSLREIAGFSFSFSMSLFSREVLASLKESFGVGVVILLMDIPD